MALAWLLGGCSTAPAPQAKPVAAVPVASAPAAVDNDQASDDDDKFTNLPKIELSDELLIRFLVGDIALQRGGGQLAAQTWHDLAKRTHDPRVAKRATEVAIGTGQLGLAREDTQIWIDAAPESQPAKQVMLSLLLRANRLDEAKPYLESLLQAQPKEISPFFAQLHLLWDKSTDRNAVLKLTEELTAPYPQLSEAQFAHAVALANVGQTDEALKLLDKAEALKPNWEAPVLYHAQLLPEQDRLDYLQAAQKRHPKLVSLQASLAKELVTQKRFAEARVLYEQVLVQQPTNLEALVGSGLVSLQMHDLETADKRLGAAIKIAPTPTSNLRFYMAQIAEERHRSDEALGLYEQVEGEMKPFADQRRIRLLAKAGRVQEALALLDAQATSDDDSKVEKIQLNAQIWREAKQYPKAYQVLSDGLLATPDNPDLLYDRSLVADLMDNDAAAEKDLRRMLELQPDSVQGLNALGYTLANRNRALEEAAKLLEAAIAKEPDNPVIIDSIGWLRFRQGKLKEARDLLSRAHGLMDDPEIAAHYAEVLWALGDKATARKVYDAALQIDPANDSLQETNKRLGIR
ncbi:tetratricopeptide repeat protein [Andreprevotia chitinilytica]|uniref:tetratricopeptide repeat protein n=1 Tax=Andreprevotia chitinilytica TaxID=396808 RepID=UPI00068FC45A|nr:tetratricopeptide repeat protein [Andreprevotia chitinilytica]